MDKLILPKKKNIIEVGSKVKIKKGTKTYLGTSLADYVYNRIYIVTQVKCDRIVLSYDGIIVTAMNEKDLILIKIGSLRSCHF